MMHKFKLTGAILICLFSLSALAQVDQYNVIWDTQSKHSGESMPCGGGDIGLNVWVEDGDILLYVARSGTFDENNALLKMGRVRVKLSPNPFEGGFFRQELVLKDGYINLKGRYGNLNADIDIWADVFRPVVHIDVQSNHPVHVEAVYESWRTEDRINQKKENNANSYKWANRKVITYKDDVGFKDNGILFYHRNKDAETVFDVTVEQQGLDSVKSDLYNPLKKLTFGGVLQGLNMKPSGTSAGKYAQTAFTGWSLKSSSPSKTHKVNVFLHIDQTENVQEWDKGLKKIISEAHKARKYAQKESRKWWNNFWDRSYVFIQPGSQNANSPERQVSRNYQLFRYMLGCNAYGKFPTKFNGGLFTYDPVFVDSTFAYSADYRSWGGGVHTAQNQRLVYFPMIKSGDFDMMKPQFDFYLNNLKNAELRSEVYWGHKGASFTEQIENFGLPNCSEYSWKRPEGYDPGLEYNAWLEYQWDTVLEFCLMVLETERYTGQDISEYIPLIESSLTFFEEHYQYRAKKRGAKMLTSDGNLILYPGSAAETYKMTYNATSTIAGLKTVLSRLLELPDPYLSAEQKKHWEGLLQKIPPISFREMQGHKTIAPALAWERIQNTEIPQLYPVYPFGIYGIGKPDLEVAVNTWKYDTEAIKNRNYTSWHQDNIFCARLGLTEEAANLSIKKLGNSGRKFPAFWGPGHDWVPDHNWGGSGMIGIQEMLMQVDGEKIYLLPAWPKNWDVNFKLHAPYGTTIECKYGNGKVLDLKVTPKERAKDVVLFPLPAER